MLLSRGTCSLVCGGGSDLFRSPDELRLSEDMQRYRRDPAAEPHNPTHIDTHSTQRLDTYNHTIAAISHCVKGEDKHEQWEDGCMCFGVVCDGHNGAEVAEKASKLLFREVIRRRQGRDKSKAAPPMSEVLTDAIIDVDLMLYEKSRTERGRYQSQGATVTAYACEDNVATLAWLGDSTAVLCDNSRAVVLTSDHNRETNAVEVSRQNALTSEPIPISVTRAVGDYALKDHADHTRHVVSNRADTVTFPISESVQFVLIASDGLWDMISPSDAVRYVSQKLSTTKPKFTDIGRYHATPKHAYQDKEVFVRAICQGLQQEAVEASRMHPRDDVTIMLILTQDVESYYTPPVLSAEAFEEADCAEPVDLAHCLTPPNKCVQDLPFQYKCYVTPVPDNAFSCPSMTPVMPVIYDHSDDDDDFMRLRAYAGAEPYLPPADADHLTTTPPVQNP